MKALIAACFILLLLYCGIPIISIVDGQSQPPTPPQLTPTTPVLQHGWIMIIGTDKRLRYVDAYKIRSINQTKEKESIEVQISDQEHFTTNVDMDVLAALVEQARNATAGAHSS